MVAIVLFPANRGVSGPALPETSKVDPSPFYLGADISTLSQVERHGGIYMDGDKPGDALAIFMKNGWTCFRLRIWVDPRNGVNGLEYTTKLAKTHQGRRRDFHARFPLFRLVGRSRRSRTNPPRGPSWILTRWSSKRRPIPRRLSKP